MNNLYINLNSKFKLNPSALIVKGASRALICDVDRHQHFLIPSALYFILKDIEAYSIKLVLEKYGENEKVIQIILEYFNFLSEKELIFFYNTNDYYDTLCLEWDFPATISNAIIDFGNNNLFFIKKILNEFNLLGTRYIQLRFFENISIKVLENILNEFNQSIIENIDIFLPYQDRIQYEVEETIYKYPRINGFTIYGATNHVGFQPINTKGRGKLFTYPNKISAKNCGVVQPFYFTNNIPHFTEAQQHNTCLNRKISIDTEGYIRNCPSMKEHYGNIRDTTLQEALQHPDFKKYWFIHKDQISVCKDCEFRYICTDCRAYLENPDDIYAKPLKCGYNPYTCEWEEWSTNPLKQKAIDHYGMREIIAENTKH